MRGWWVGVLIHMHGLGFLHLEPIGKHLDCEGLHLDHVLEIIHLDEDSLNELLLVKLFLHQLSDLAHVHRGR